jgi:hypothetical protein
MAELDFADRRIAKYQNNSIPRARRNDYLLKAWVISVIYTRRNR